MRQLLICAALLFAAVFGSPLAADSPVERLGIYLKQDREQRPPLVDQVFASQPLSAAQAQAARQLLWDDHARWIRTTRAAEIEQKKLQRDGVEMKFDFREFGDPPAEGRSLFISLHGGGGTSARKNDG